ncbi:hypothetical protein H7J88_05685 [Mycolicibacterium flavescens]|uniref:DUF2993 domain-containing protein n=1 Tax=Mycolicibacterium flavescens TaxID=1776 RepID=A0A1E3RAG1_MYCFV|nr:hypothetical protein [Mycolicibacterium flavescens]MCV7279136.1 hypothetical protein [Mycolicibacterium flavescens]ODQ86906.1 hypothetical protein BHQ18_25645 [Mycolicibacterium flavescens]
MTHPSPVALLTAPIGLGAAIAQRAMVMPLRLLVVGRRLTVGLDGGELNLTVTEFDPRLDVRGLSVGRLSDVRLAACDIRWWGTENDSYVTRFDHATAVLHNVRIRPPVLVAEPVELTLEVPAPALDGLFEAAAPRLSGDIGPDGIARLRLARRPGAGHVEVEARLEGSTLWLHPRGLALRRSRWTLPGRLPAYPVRLPALPHGMQLTNIAFAPGVVRLSAQVEHWRMQLPLRRLL